MKLMISIIFSNVLFWSNLYFKIIFTIIISRLYL